MNYYVSKTYKMVTYTQSHIDIKDLNPSRLGELVKINGWVRNIRIQASLIFIEAYDGSTSKTIQLITEDTSHFDQLYTLNIGSAISVSGTVTQHPTKQDQVEIKIATIHYTSKIHDPLHNPLNAKKTSLEMLRDHQDSRVKTRTFNAVFRIRAGLSKATHDYFHTKGYHHLNPNIITTSDCEGGGEVFTITTLLDKSTATIPIKQETLNTIDYNKDFFEKQAFLTVSSQLQLELLCAGLGKVWTSNKSFRSEKSRTTRHLAEFEHIEWETAWCDLVGLMDMSEEFTQYAFNYVLTNHRDDLEELNKFTSKGLISKLESFMQPYIRITYDEAISIIDTKQDEIKKLYKLETLPKWGDDLGSECEKYLAENIYKQPLFVYNYPKALKSFYMMANPDNRTVQGCDLLIPGLGELIGSSVREYDYDRLMQVVKERNMDPSPLKWYLELRRNGSTPTAGAGLGFDRLVRICTGMENIRDAVPFPVAYQECRF